MRAYLNAAYHCWAANKIFNSRSSKTAILAILKSFEKPLKKKPILFNMFLMFY